MLFECVKTEGSDEGLYMDRFIFRVLLEIVLVGDKTITEILRIEVVFLFHLVLFHLGEVEW